MSKDTRYIIGIDLGTTHCALSYVDTFQAGEGVQSLDLLQWDSEGGIIEKPTLPSFIYFLTKGEIKRQDKQLPFSSHQELIAGREARDKLGERPGRVIHSAKSWLCHGGVNRSSKILPWQSEELIGDQRLSPIDAASFLLEHLKNVWNWKFQGEENPESNFSQQEILITVPASFDEVAQRLTLQAAFRVGYPQSTRLIEEPQAAFFDWVMQDNAWQSRLVELAQLSGKNTSSKVLICDIGGGTTDFSLLEIKLESDGEPQIKRTRVSNHILLGGDNIDLSLGKMIEERRRQSSDQLRADVWLQLLSRARQIKEEILSQPGAGDETIYVAVSRPGASLFESTESIAVQRRDVESLIYEGFFPLCQSDDLPSDQDSSALSEWGLPYANDTAITRHLAKFLGGESIDAVLFAGGSLKPDRIRRRLFELLRQWQTQPLIELTGTELDLMVSRGAAAYALLNRLNQKTIKATYPRAVYLKVQSHTNKGDQLLRLIPQGTALGRSFQLTDLNLQALTNQRVEFEIWISASDTGSEVGKAIHFQDVDAHPLPPLHTVLSHSNRKQEMTEVILKAEITETGLLKLTCQDRQDPTHEWELEFSLQQDRIRRKESQKLEQGEVAPALSTLSDTQITRAQDLIQTVFGRKKLKDIEVRPTEVSQKLEDIIGLPRTQWSLAQVRQLWEPLREGMTRRQRSLEHEASWLNLAGFCLRPGFGALKDPERCEELWRCFEMGPAHPKESRVMDQWWILWRRVAGGLNEERQNIIFDKNFPLIRKGQAEAGREMILLMGSLERVEMNRRVQLGRTLSRQIISGKKDFLDAKIWALARIASRIPLYGNAENMVPPVFLEEWIDELKELNLRQKHYRNLINFFSQAGRRLDQREFDISASHRQICFEKLTEGHADESHIIPLERYLPPNETFYQELFGEDLPIGIHLA